MTHNRISGPVLLRPSPSDRRSTVLTEALAYVGGVVLLTGIGLVAARYWPDLQDSARLAITATAALVLLSGGLAIPGQSPAARRLRGTIWLGSTAAAVLFFGLLGDTLGWRPMNITLLAGLGSSAYAVVPWLLSKRMAGPQLVLVVTTLVAAGAIGAHANAQYWPGLAVWFAALEWFLLAHGSLVRAEHVTQLAAAAGLVVGSGMMMPLDIGIIVGLVTVAGLLVYAFRGWNLALVTIGAIGALQILPIAVNEWFPGRLVAPLVLLAAGLILVGTAVVLARRATDGSEPASTGGGPASPVNGSALPDNGAALPENDPARPENGSASVDAMRFDAVVFDLGRLTAGSAGAAVPALSALIGRLVAAGLSTAAVWTDLAAAEELAQAGLGELFDLHVGACEPGLANLPEPDAFLVAARRLGVRPSRTVVLAATPAGAQAARAGAFGLVIGIGRGRRAGELRVLGADPVVADYTGIRIAAGHQPVR
ncbi:hypothetical protein [Kribbella ginsengisoli]|uniref:Uncharacterized protein n=1 Tax=Kribbella ginsengisoli TaxID=363865 RepID=A0ABP6YVG3_9ACTN